LTAPKTDTSVAVIPVEFPLDSLLNSLREASGNPEDGFILRSEKNGKALNFEWLSREVIRPTLKAARNRRNRMGGVFTVVGGAAQPISCPRRRMLKGPLARFATRTRGSR